MSAERNKFYVTTPIYYVNARPHIGHAYTTIVADVLARRHRLLGEDVFFLTGTDEHGQKIERSAAAAGVPPQAFADDVSAAFKALWDRMGITYDDYIRTTEDRHAAGAQKLFADLYARGYIYLSTYTGAYCVSDEAFVDAPIGSPCPDCGRTLEEVTEENFFFKLSEFQLPLLNAIESGELRIENEARRNEVLSFVRGGLKDLSISRSSFTWGIPVPDSVLLDAKAKDKHVIYVWLDALANYMTAVGYGDDSAEAQTKLAKWWPADLHLVGKEIIRFHCVYWPAFLMAAELPLPKAITAHGWLLFDNSKMSKSKGNIVRTETILEAFGEHVYGKQFPESTKAERDLFASDVLRYFLLREIPFGQDGGFSFDALITRYNADLANGYGNLVSRTLKMVQQYCESVIRLENRDDWSEEGWLNYAFGKSPGVTAWSSPDEPFDPKSLRQYGMFQTIEHAIRVRELLSGKYGDAGFQSQLGEHALAVSMTDGFISDAAPWQVAKDGTLSHWLEDILYTSAEAIRIATALLHPFLPFATARVWQQLGLGDIEAAARNGELNNLEWGGLRPGTKLGQLAPIFPRADKGLAQIMSDMEEQDTQLKNSQLATEKKPSELDSSSLKAHEKTPSAKPDTEPRPDAPLKAALTPSHAAAVPTSSTDPGAPPRAFDSHAEPSGVLSVGGSAALTTEREGTPRHSEAQASGVFAGATSQAPAAEAATTDASPQITIDDFAKVELRVAQIVACERIPKADKLLRLEVDLGYEKRQILSGIAEWYTPEELIGRRIVVITNLAPRKMRGLESHGMLLAASNGEGGKPVLATFGEDIALGSRLK